MTDKQYVKSGGLKCPFCRSAEVTTDSQDLDGPDFSTKDHCEACGQEWLSIYALAGYTPSEDLGDNNDDEDDDG
jgi:hypothetical protein